MPAQRTSANEAWIVSLVLHVAMVALVIAVLGGLAPSELKPIVIDTKDSGSAISVVMLGATAERPITVPTVAVEPMVARPPIPQQPAASPTPTTVRPAVHEESSSPAVDTAPQTAAQKPVLNAAATTPPQPIPPQGPPLPAGASTAFFGVPAIGKSVVFVIDRSASMGLDGRLDRARRELAESLKRLPPSARFQVIAYNRVVEPLRLSSGSDLVPATPDVITAAIEHVDRLAAEGGTDHVRSLSTAIALAPDVIYFLTDEDDLTASDVQSIVRLNHGRVCIHSLCIVPPSRGNTPMQNMARWNRGQFKIVGP